MVRTNNDVEGYHNRINHRGRPNQAFYSLIALLHAESKFVSLQIRLMSTNKLRKYQRKTYARIHGQYEKLWDRYADPEDDLGVSGLLRKVARINGPVE